MAYRPVSLVSAYVFRAGTANSCRSKLLIYAVTNTEFLNYDAVNMPVTVSPPRLIQQLRPACAASHNEHPVYAFQRLTGNQRIFLILYVMCLSSSCCFLFQS
jgi:hypothetical protein